MNIKTLINLQKKNQQYLFKKSKNQFYTGTFAINSKDPKLTQELNEIAKSEIKKIKIDLFKEPSTQFDFESLKESVYLGEPIISYGHASIKKKFLRAVKKSTLKNPFKSYILDSHNVLKLEFEKYDLFILGMRTK